MKKDLTIGVLGGMGTYATINLFKQYAQIFPAEKEWDRPRIIIDNRCTMPSRVRAFLYHENEDVLVEQMGESLRGLVEQGCNRIILACNTSHIFLEKIYVKYPEVKNAGIENIIYNCAEEINKNNLDKVFLLGSEGTIDSGIYQRILAEYGVTCEIPDKFDYPKLRKCIEAVKQDKYSEDIKEIFLDLIKDHETCILGCTELPILYERYLSKKDDKLIFDPIYITLKKIKEEYNNE